MLVLLDGDATLAIGSGSGAMAEEEIAPLATPVAGSVTALLERRGIAGGRADDDGSRLAENFPGAGIVVPAVVAAAVSVDDDEFLFAGGGTNGCIVGGSAMNVER